MKYTVTTKDFDLDWGKKKLSECILFESDKLIDCKTYATKNNIPFNRILKSNGRIAIGDWYGAYDDDLGWEYD